MKLVIISHTEHYKRSDGSIVGWGPTVSEINYLSAVFTRIVHVAMLHEGDAPPSALPYTNDTITFVPLPVVGGSSMQSKIESVKTAPKILRIVKQQLKSADYFQLRTPTGIGVYLIPFLSFSKYTGWYKYAGNWNQKHPPLGYALQRWFLKHQSKPVTINGKWRAQPKHCVTFENPCLTLAELNLGTSVIEKKALNGQITLCYVGRLETPKGVGRIIEAISGLEASVKARLLEVHLVGDGAERKAFEALAAHTGVKFVFHGFLPRDHVFDIYKVSHGFLMPTTASEGFPKVLAEAMNFGCIPLVSQVSAISQYVLPGCNGFVMADVKLSTIREHLTAFVNLSPKQYSEYMLNGQDIVKKFTFEYYNAHIKAAILPKL